jgi:hypothetical protein
MSERKDTKSYSYGPKQSRREMLILTAMGRLDLPHWVLLDWMWADLEPQEGKFHWSELDHVIQYWVQKGKQIGCGYG